MERKPNERIAAVIIANWMGVIAAALIWLLEKEKSKYVAFQALQAVAYQFMGLLVWMAGLFCYMATLFGGIGLAALLNPQGEGEGIVAFFSLAPICAFFLLSLRDPVRMGPPYPLWPIRSLCFSPGSRFQIPHPRSPGREIHRGWLSHSPDGKKRAAHMGSALLSLPEIL